MPSPIVPTGSLGSDRATDGSASIVHERRPIRILHLIAGLDVGGAQTTLTRLIAGMDGARFQNTVISMTSRGPVATDLDAHGTEVAWLGMRRGWPDPRGIIRLQRLVARIRPNLIQTWMYHADLMGGITGRQISHVPVVWGIHHTSFDSLVDKRGTRWTAWTCARLAGRLPSWIVCCSEASRDEHARIGYPRSRMSVIYNGVDTWVFRRDESTRSNVRRELGLDPRDILIGIAARFHPQKDLPGTIEAIRLLSARDPSVHWVMCGPGMSTDNPELMSWIQAAGIADRVSMLGVLSDLPRVMPAWDVASLGSSHGEGFPVSIIEAMACGVPCVVTSVGDLPKMVGESGIVVPPRTPEALADAWRGLIEEGDESRRARGRLARRRVEEHYGSAQMVSAYETLYTREAKVSPPPKGGNR